jgi:alpha-tubulin suppressor-like RCC1 family protein
MLRGLTSSSTTAADTAEVRVELPTPLLPQLPTELIVEVLWHLDLQGRGRLACTCRQLYFGPPCSPRSTSLVEAAIRRRADAIGRCTPSSLPADVSAWVPFLLERERRIGLEMRTVAAGLDRSSFVDTNGALLACGSEDEGENGLLGLRGGTDRTLFTAVVLTPVPSMAGVRVRSVVSTYYCNLAVSEAGQVFAWRQQVERSLADEAVVWSKAQPLEPTVMEELREHRVRQVAANEFHCAALTEDGALFTWETRIEHAVIRGEPELGYGSNVFETGVPYPVRGLESVRITSVAVGLGFTVAATEARAVYTFGDGDGRLGLGELCSKSVCLPRRIEALDGIHVATFVAGDIHTLALTRCGRVYSWGANGGDCELGLDHESVDVGDDSSQRDDMDYTIPQLIKALLDVRVQSIAAGPSVSCAVTDSGALYTWGGFDPFCSPNFGNLGHGDLACHYRPTLVQGLQGIHVVGVSISFKHTLALAADGSVYAFGEGAGLGFRHGSEGEEDDSEEDGEEDAEPTHSPQRIPGLVCMVPPCYGPCK